MHVIEGRQVGGDEVCGEEGWAARDRLHLPTGHRQYFCVFSKWQKQTQSTVHAETVVGSSLAPYTFLLVPFTGSTGPVEHLHSLTGLAEGHLWKQTWPLIVSAQCF